MKTISFELTMPNVGSWNGKWTGADRKYFIVKTVSEKYFKSNIEKLFDLNNTQSRSREYKWNSWYYNFGDGWGASVEINLINSTEGKKRRKLSKGFSGYDWMVDSIMRYGSILTESQIKERIISHT
jgi:hypothetical protein